MAVAPALLDRNVVDAGDAQAYRWDTRSKKPWNLIERVTVPLSRKLLTALPW